jgi:hypothetical protein
MTERWKKGLLAAGWNLRKAVELAVRIEDMGRELYLALAAKWDSNASLGAPFTQLASDEVAHGEAFEALLSTLGKPRRRAVDLLDEECLRAIAFTVMNAMKRLQPELEHPSPEEELGPLNSEPP